MKIDRRVDDHDGEKEGKQEGADEDTAEVLVPKDGAHAVYEIDLSIERVFEVFQPEREYEKRRYEDGRSCDVDPPVFARPEEDRRERRSDDPREVCRSEVEPTDAPRVRVLRVPFDDEIEVVRYEPDEHCAHYEERYRDDRVL